MTKEAVLKSFDHYLDESGEPKTLSLYEILQLDKSFFENYNDVNFRKHAEKLYLTFHPDKNKTNSDKATAVWKMIHPAVQEMANPESRKAFLLKEGLVSSSSADFTFSDFNFDEWIHEQASELDQIEIMLDSLSAQGAEDGSTLVTQVNFKAVIDLVFANAFVLLHSQEHANKFFPILLRLKELAETGQDFYALGQLVSRDRLASMRYGDEIQAAAASRGHWISMRAIAGTALSGLYNDKEASIIWALNCIRYMEKVVLPYLDASDDPQDKKDLENIKRGLVRARERIDGHNGEYSKGKEIPEQGSEEFNALVASIIPKVEQVDPRADFLLSNEIFTIVGSNPNVKDKDTLEQLKSLFEPAKKAATRSAAEKSLTNQKMSSISEKVDNKFAQAKNQLEELISELDTLKQHGDRYVAVEKKSDDLYQNLYSAITTFIDSSGEQNKETLKELIETCSRAMQDQKTQLNTYKKTFFTEPETDFYKKLNEIHEHLLLLSKNILEMSEDPNQPVLFPNFTRSNNGF